MEQIKSKEMQIAKELILKTFSFLEDDYSYIPKFDVINSAVFMEYGAVEYINEAKKRSVDVSYTKGDVYGEIKYTFNLGIVRIPHSESGDMIALSNFLTSKNKDFDTRLHGEFKADEAERILQRIADVLRKELTEVVEGNTWYENYYPRKD